MFTADKIFGRTNMVLVFFFLHMFICTSIDLHRGRAGP